MRNNRLALMGAILRLNATIAKLLTGRDDDAESFTVASSLVCFVHFHFLSLFLSFFLPFFYFLSSLGFLPLFLSFLPSQVCFFFLHILYNICFLISNPPFQLSMRSGPFACTCQLRMKTELHIWRKADKG